MIVNVEHTVPVEVQVDTQTGQVLRVVVMDECVTLAGKPGARIVEQEGAIPISDEDTKQKALEIATGNAMWPAWEFGW